MSGKLFVEFDELAEGVHAFDTRSNKSVVLMAKLDLDSYYDFWVAEPDEGAYIIVRDVDLQDPWIWDD